MLLVKVNEATALRRRVYFHLVDATDGVTPALSEAGGQPQVSVNGGAWTNTGIGSLVAIGNGRYYADPTQALVATTGDSVETRYKSVNTAECPGDSIRVVAFDPYDEVTLGLDVGTQTSLDTLQGDVTGVKAKTDQMVFTTAGNLDCRVNYWQGAAVVLGGGSETAVGPLVNARIFSVQNDTLAAANMEAFFDGSGYDIGLPTAIENADALLDREDGIEAGVSPRQFFRRVGAVWTGTNSGAGTGTEKFYAVGNPATLRAQITVDENGNRSVITFS